MTSAVRSDEAFLCQSVIAEPASKVAHPVSAIESMRSELFELSSAELAILEDELDFYAFTGIAGPYVKKLLQCS
jgi:hypothetical protein